MLADRSIRTKVVLGMGCVLSLLVAGAGYATLALSRIDRSMAAIADSRRQSDVADTIEEAVGAVKFRTTRYLATGADKEAAEAAIVRARGEIEAARGLVATPELQADVAAMADRLERFGSVWTKVLGLRAERDALVGQTLATASAKVRSEASFLAARTAASEKPETGFVAGKIIEYVSDLRMSVAQVAAGSHPQALEQADMATSQILGRVETLVRQLEGMQEGSLAGKFGRSVVGLKEIYHKAAALGDDLARAEKEDIEPGVESIASLAVKLRDHADEQTRAIQSEAAETLAATDRSVLVGAAVLLLVGSVLAWLVGRSIARPIVRLSAAMRAIAGGRLDTEVPYASRRDEVGQMAGTLKVFRESLVEADALREAEAGRARDAEAERRRQLQAVAGAFEQAIGGIVRSVEGAARDLEGSARSMTAASRQVAERTGQALGASRQAADSVVQVAASAEELTASIGEIDRQVTESARIAGEAVGEIERTAGEIGTLSGAAQRIGEVVGLISGIAAQTNLLALNATIEAARAGEAGRGFAVVAAEVKQLADQTAKATAEISGQITAIQSQTERAVQSIGGISAVIERMNRTTAAVTAAVEQQASATREIAASVNVAADGTQGVSANIGEVGQVSERSAADAAKVLTASRGVAEQAGRLSAELDGFLARVRAS